MHIKITYPSVEKGRMGRRKLLSILRWPFISAAVASVTVNLIIGSPYWFPIVLLSLWGVWKFVFSTSLVEYNRISQFVKLVIYTCALLTLVDIFIISGWARFVVPIVCFSGIILSPDMVSDWQQKDMQPLDMPSRTCLHERGESFLPSHERGLLVVFQKLSLRYLRKL